MKAVEKWLDRIAFASVLAVAAIDAIRADYCAMFGFLCAAMWVSVAAMRRRERDMWRKACKRAIGAEVEGN